MNGSERVKKWRRDTKERIIKIMGGQCQICSYNKSQTALELHHIDPTKKELSFASVRANPKKWDDIFNELLKCILLCANCHREIHDGTTKLPDEYILPDESLRNYKLVPTIRDVCSVCGKEKLKVNKTCSYKCSFMIRSKIKWAEIDLYDLLVVKKLSYCEIGRRLGVSDNAVRKRAKNLALYKWLATWVLIPVLSFNRGELHLKACSE